MTAIGVVETLSIPMGVLAGDQMVKTAQVDLVTAQTVCAGKYIVVVSGEVAAVRSSVSAGIESAGSTLVDSLVIPNVDERVVAAMAGACPAEQVEAVGVVETFSLASAMVRAMASSCPGSQSIITGIFSTDVSSFEKLQPFGSAALEKTNG